MGTGNYLANTERRANGDIFDVCFIVLELNAFAT